MPLSVGIEHPDPYEDGVLTTELNREANSEWFICYELYLQVRFHSLSTVVRVATRGGAVNYVTQYRLAFSEDCASFMDLLDVAGNNAVNNIIIWVTSFWYG